MTKKERKERIETVMKVVNLEDAMYKIVAKFSGGMKRRLSLAIAMLHEPQILILDEPTVGMDPILRKSIWESFNALKESVVSIIVTTHVMDEAEKCDRLGMIRNGKLIATGSADELKKNSQVNDLESAFLKFGGEQYAD